MTPATADRLIRAHTSIQTTPLVPEIHLHLAALSRAIWQHIEEAAGDPRAQRPFWAFAWPGGQAVARFLIDNPRWIRGKHVLDLGCGSGIAAIAAMRAGALSVLANDIDPLAVRAAAFNADLNDVTLATSTADLLGGAPGDVDLILLSDVVYEPELATRVAGFVANAVKRQIPILFGDRGQTRLPRAPKAELARYRADVVPPMDQHFEDGIVWQLA